MDAPVPGIPPWDDICAHCATFSARPDAMTSAFAQFLALRWDRGQQGRGGQHIDEAGVAGVGGGR
jgi:hypothetical protein